MMNILKEHKYIGNNDINKYNLILVCKIFLQKIRVSILDSKSYNHETIIRK